MNTLLWPAVQFPLFILFQKFLFEALSLGRFDVPNVYIIYILFFPINFPRYVSYFVAFLFGLCMDFLTPPVGAGAFACVFIASLRNVWVRFIAPSYASADERMVLEEQSAGWLFLYVAPLVFIYQILYVGLSDFGYSLQSIEKIFFSSIYSIFINFIIVILFYKREGKK